MPVNKLAAQASSPWDSDIAYIHRDLRNAVLGMFITPIRLIMGGVGCILKLS